MSKLHQHGFEPFTLNDLAVTEEQLEALVELITPFLELDHYSNLANRTRVIARFILTNGGYRPESPVRIAGKLYYEYTLSETDNPEQGGRTRRFAAVPIEAKLIANPVIKQLLNYMAGLCPCKAPGYWFDLQFISYEPTPGNPSVVTPDLIHEDGLDGQTLSAVMTLQRMNVEGGEFIVATRSALGTQVDAVMSKDILSLSAMPPGEGFIFDENTRGGRPSVAHGARATHSTGTGQPSRRLIVAVEVTPRWDISANQ